MKNRWQKIRETIAPNFWAVAALFCGVLLPLVVLGKIADNVHDGDSFSFDDQILLFFHQFASIKRDSLVMHFTDLGRVQWMVPFCILVTAGLWISRRRSQAKFFALSSAGAAVLNVAAKLFFGRDRPALWTSPAPETDFGFPSGHAMVSMAVMLALAILLWPTRYRWPMTLFAVFFVTSIGLTRLYLGVHYPTDVLGGWCAALAWVGGLNAAILARQRWRARLDNFKAKHRVPEEVSTS
ncbi:MAG TPA: phosphatase PAP2 family protein [Abditibacterium sp.]|jgi:undecaprenyl-diphosphatase